MAEPPSKPCVSCGRTITWRRAWARDWDEVRYCSAGCRRRKVTDTDRALEDALGRALDRRGATVDPRAVARALGPDASLIEPARRAARRLVAQGGYEILVDGRVSDPSTARGPFVLRRRD